MLFSFKSRHTKYKRYGEKMIDIIFSFGTEHIFVRVQNCDCFFRTQQSSVYATIDGLKLDRAGAIKEFPELKDDSDWKNKVINKFKEKMKQLTTEKERAEYLMSDLIKYGYKPLYIQKQGFRAVKLC